MVFGAGFLSPGQQEVEAVPEEFGDPVLAQFLARQPLPDCGQVELGQLANPRDTKAIRACLKTAGSDGAEASVTEPTVEGDPVTTYYRVTPNGHWETYVDSTQDAFGSGEWEFMACQKPKRNPLKLPCRSYLRGQTPEYLVP